MSNTSDEYSSVPGNAIGATEYPSTKLAQADELQKIQDNLFKRKKSNKRSKIYVTPSQYSGAVKLATEAFIRQPLKFKKSKYKSLQNKVSNVDSPGWDSKGFLPGGWRGDPTSAMLNQGY